MKAHVTFEKKITPWSNAACGRNHASKKDGCMNLFIVDVTYFETVPVAQRCKKCHEVYENRNTR